MTKITWLLVGVLVFSLVANGLLGFSTYLYGTQLRQTQAKLNERIIKYNEATASLARANANLRAANASIAGLQSDLLTSQALANDYRDRASKAEYFVDRAKCPAMVDELTAYGASSNNGVKPAVVAALERMYDGSVRSSSFVTLWDNSKSSILTALWGDGSTKTILSWDRNDNLKTVYDANSGCVMYTR